jgi:RNA 3'-terminal phosphate cyclase (ATP)
MRKIDGSIGEGGGQILRSALALSLCTGEAVQIKNIRARREKPGLRPQHLAAVRAAAEVGRADLVGAEIGSRDLSFTPRTITPGQYTFDIGTAGSTSLVLQTVLPALLTLSAPSSLDIIGGTHNPQAPTYDFIAKAYLPIITRMGPRICTELVRPGFYPKGGGLIRVRIEPCPSLARLQLEMRGALKKLRAEVLLAQLPVHIADRETSILESGLPQMTEPVVVRRADDSFSPGNVVTVYCQSEHVTEAFTACGERGVRAERVAKQVVAATQAYLDSNVPVGPLLADQLLVPLALAGTGSFVTTAPSSHTLTNLAVIEQMLGPRLICARIHDGHGWRIGE